MNMKTIITGTPMPQPGQKDHEAFKTPQEMYEYAKELALANRLAESQEWLQRASELGHYAAQRALALDTPTDN